MLYDQGMATRRIEVLVTGHSWETDRWTICRACQAKYLANPRVHEMDKEATATVHAVKMGRCECHLHEGPGKHPMVG